MYYIYEKEFNKNDNYIKNKNIKVIKSMKFNKKLINSD